ncbi:hypothetical protein [Actinobaculum sp. 313]|uniref:hypothetical protein n=1 Tax=Actinobaculum sp. 313 TaxID=2495645 RepID=UPI000F73F147|nr:hypothetical protein [Actinobaculum sp. 313]
MSGTSMAVRAASVKVAFRATACITTATIAVPNAEPTCRKVERTPDAAPATSFGTPRIAIAVVGVNRPGFDGGSDYTEGLLS